jgi:HEPN domain-containing protein
VDIMMRTDLDHLPWPIRLELRHVSAIIFEEFAEAIRGKQAVHRKAGRILKLILHGTFARPDWNRTTSLDGIDLLAIVNHEELTDIDRHWRFTLDRLQRAWETGDFAHPVRLAVYSLAEVNGKLCDGVPYFAAITTDGIALYELTRTPLASPRRLPPHEMQDRVQAEFERWFPKAGDFLAGAGFYHGRGNPAMAALLLHQASEHLYQCVTWTLTLHGRRTHALDELRELAERQDARLCFAWPRESRFERRCFARIRRAYVEARYAVSFHITEDELAWAMDRTAELHRLVEKVCRDRLDLATLPPCATHAEVSHVRCV